MRVPDWDGLTDAVAVFVGVVVWVPLLVAVCVAVAVWLAVLEPVAV